VLHRGTGTVTAGAYAQISQTGVNLTGATKIIFDCQDTGIDLVPLRFIVDDNIIGAWYNNGWPGGQGSGWGHTAVTTGIEIPLGASTRALTIRAIRRSIASTICARMSFPSRHRSWLRPWASPRCFFVAVGDSRPQPRDNFLICPPEQSRRRA